MDYKEFARYKCFRYYHDYYYYKSSNLRQGLTLFLLIAFYTMDELQYFILANATL